MATVQLEPLTDGLLVLRLLFGFTGATLISGAVGAGCTRCDATSILAYLEPLLDIDHDGQVEALTDGLLILPLVVRLLGKDPGHRLAVDLAKIARAAPPPQWPRICRHSDPELRRHPEKWR